MRDARIYRFSSSQLLIICVLLAFILLINIWQAFQGYQSEQNSIEKRQTAYVNAMTSHAERVVGESVQILDHVLDDVLQAGGARASEKKLYAIFVGQINRSPQVGSIFLIKEDGYLQSTSLEYPARRLSLAFRDFYPFHRDHKSDAIYFSQPGKNKIDNTWRIVLSRRLNGRDGRFEGVLAISLKSEYFQNVYRSLDPLPTERFSLFNLRGDRLASIPFSEQAMTTNMAGSELFTQHLPKAAAGNFESESYSFDKSHRLVTYRMLSNAPLVTSVSIEKKAMFTAWRKQLLWRLLFMLISVGTTLWLLLRYYRLSDQTTQQLETLVQERTRSLVDISHDLAQNEQKLQALLDISQFQAENSQELLDFALEKVMQITASQFGYIYHYREEQQEFVLNSWSKGVMPSCSVASPQTLYQLEKTGIWGEAVRQRRRILINDFAAPDPLKKGYPEGHVPLSRFLTVPVFDIDRRIVAVVGVANKEEPYSEQDAIQLELMMAEVWRITKRLELELKLINAGREWHTTFDAISDSVALIDRNQKILRCNQASTRLFGRSYSEIVDHHCYELLHGSVHPVDACPMVRAVQSRRSENQLIFEHGRWLHVTVDPLLDEQGEVTGAVHIVHDDTERVMAEQAQLDLLELFRQLMLHSPVYIYIKEMLEDTSVVLQASENFTDMVGIPGSKIINKRMEEIFPAAVAAKIIRDDYEVVSKGVVFECEEELHGRSYFTIKFPIRLGSKQLLAGYTLDITGRKQAERSLKEMQAQLLQNEKMASIGQLSAGIAHEINNPMGFINSNLGTLEKYVEKFDRYIALLEKLVQDSSDEHGRQEAAALRKALKLDYVLQDIVQLLHESADGAERVLKIVQDLKIFARSDTAQIARADLNQSLDSTINIIWNQIKYVADLQKEYGELPKVACNVQQINQVFMNLLVNAVHAIESQGSGELGTITITTSADDASVFISIADTGCGISPEVQRRIFDPFFTTKEVGKGTGLGLSISYDIINKHGGEIIVESTEGAGTVFTVRLPITPPPPKCRNNRGLEND
jgi:PAS domain S-box-containing protein